VDIVESSLVWVKARELRGTKRGWLESMSFQIQRMKSETC
jgi:hypothetical protein